MNRRHTPRVTVTSVLGLLALGSCGAAGLRSLHKAQSRRSRGVGATVAAALYKRTS